MNEKKNQAVRDTTKNLLNKALKEFILVASRIERGREFHVPTMKISLKKG